MFAKGFAAIEAEFVVQLAKDAPANVAEWTTETARRFVKAMYIGIEIASSPLANINDFGPAVVASDFGNNAGLLLGAEIVDWQTRSLESLNCETRIDGVVVGRGSAAAVSGGPLAALAFALRCNARRGRPLRAGELRFDRRRNRCPLHRRRTIRRGNFHRRRQPEVRHGAHDTGDNDR